MYRIIEWFPRGKEQSNGGTGFNILLKKKWFEMVSETSVDQCSIDNFITNLGKQMLAGHGWSHVENPHQHIRVWWNDGFLTIQVPGSACQIGYEPLTYCSVDEGEVMLVPHNMDTISQASLALTVFLKIAEYVENCKK